MDACLTTRTHDPKAASALLASFDEGSRLQQEWLQEIDQSSGELEEQLYQLVAACEALAQDHQILAKSQQQLDEDLAQLVLERQEFQAQQEAWALHQEQVMAKEASLSEQSTRQAALACELQDKNAQLTELAAQLQAADADKAELSRQLHLAKDLHRCQLQSLTSERDAVKLQLAAVSHQMQSALTAAAQASELRVRLRELEQQLEACSKSPAAAAPQVEQPLPEAPKPRLSKSAGSRATEKATPVVAAAPAAPAALVKAEDAPVRKECTAAEGDAAVKNVLAQFESVQRDRRARRVAGKPKS